VSDSNTVHGVFTGAPSYFPACCIEASRGGRMTYAHAGFHLGLHIRTHAADDASCEEWDTLVDEMVARLTAGDHETAEERGETVLLALDESVVPGIVAWFEAHMPKCVALVPLRRRARFVEGLVRAWLRGDLA